MLINSYTDTEIVSWGSLILIDLSPTPHQPGAYITAYATFLLANNDKRFSKPTIVT